MLRQTHGKVHLLIEQNAETAILLQGRDETASTISLPQSVHSVIDDVPKTPKKKPIGILDPENSSLLTEAVFVSVGIIALGAGLIFAYKYFRRPA